MPRPSPPSPAPAWSRSPTSCPSAPLEPHLAEAGRYGGFSGAREFRHAAAALKGLLRELSVPWQ